jgi:hypothetical protein
MGSSKLTPVKNKGLRFTHRIFGLRALPGRSFTLTANMFFDSVWPLGDLNCRATLTETHNIKFGVVK